MSGHMAAVVAIAVELAFPRKHAERARMFWQVVSSIERKPGYVLSI
jgi:hypothetical protein